MLPINILLVNEQERRNRLRFTREESRFLRDRSDPFSLTDRRFVDLFRLNKDLVVYLFHRLENVMNDATRNTRIHYQARILTALRFFASGNYQRGIGQEYILALSQQVVSRCVTEVSVSIQNNLGNEWVKFPENNIEKITNKTRFFEKCGFPGVIGAIDCTHIAILAPHVEEHNYINRKGFHSKNVQLICNADTLILNVNANFPGSCHDAFIWRQSVIREQLENDFVNGEGNNTWLLGDSGYPQQPWLMTPIMEAVENTPEERYNRSHSIGRSSIERVNGLLKTRFRCLLGERKLRYDPYKVGIIINACCILHNMCTQARIEIHEDILEEDNANNADARGDVVADFLEEGRRLRQNIVNRYFANE